MIKNIRSLFMLLVFALLLLPTVSLAEQTLVTEDMSSVSSVTTVESLTVEDNAVIEGANSIPSFEKLPVKDTGGYGTADYLYIDIVKVTSSPNTGNPGSTQIDNPAQGIVQIYAQVKY